MKNLTFFLLLLLCLVACKKEDCRRPDTTVTGTVVDEQTSQPIEDVTITLIWHKCKRDFMGVSCSDINVLDPVKTDVNGNFELKFCRLSKEYKIHFDKWGYDGGGVDLDQFLNSNGIAKLGK